MDSWRVDLLAVLLGWLVCSEGKAAPSKRHVVPSSASSREGRRSKSDGVGTLGQDSV